MSGNVLKNKIPEWPRDVRFFTNDGYPIVDHACQYNASSGTLDVPLLEQFNYSNFQIPNKILK